MLQKRLNHGFNGYEVPPIPRAPRSARRRVPYRKKSNDDPMCAFDLLATVAGKLLEGENTPATELHSAEVKNEIGKDSVRKEKLAEVHPDKVIPCDEEKSGRNFFVSEIISQAPAAKNSLKEVSPTQNDACSAFASVITTSDGSEMFGSAAKLSKDENKIQHGIFSKVEAENYRSSNSFTRLDIENKNKNRIKIEPPNTGKEPISPRGDICCLEGQVVQVIKPRAAVNSDNGVKSGKPSVLHNSSQKAFYRDRSPVGSFPTCRDNVKLVSRDDDENSSGCSQPRKLNKALRPPPRIGDRRIKRLLASRYWKVTPKSNTEDCFNTGQETKSVYHNRTNNYKRQRSLRDYPFKKRRLYDRSLATNAYEGVSSDDASFPGGCGENASGSVATKHEVANGASTYAASQQKCFQPSDSHVKLKIKSFRVPELFFEIPETATVGSLKRTVMEAVTAILGGGLRVGVLVQGKKIRDDNKTLVQTGIYDNSKNDALGFTLEPLSSQVPPPQFPEDHPFVPPQQLTRCAHTSIILKQGNSDVSTDLPTTNFGNVIESDHDSAPSPPDMSIDRGLMDSRALVAGPEMNVEALSAVPMRKSKRLDVGQRRIRRPFSVSEVEALVQAVEKLGTGRWRDVKMRAFDNAKHRTYVDLKDKWKTLVHTARISPQQRRGEPVPQELLDRVLAAHAFWSQQQAKQQLKQHSEACLLF